MSEWLRFSKLGEYYVDYRFDDVKEPSGNYIWLSFAVR